MRRLASAGLACLMPVAAAQADATSVPQIDTSTPLLFSQVVWMGLIFVGLYFALARWALPQVQSVLDQRAATIGGDLEAARLSKERADAAVAELTASTRQAQAQAQAQIADAVAVAQADAAKLAAASNEQLDAQLDAAERRIGAARQAALGSLRDVARGAAATVVARLTGAAPDDAALDAAVGQAMERRAA